MKKRIIIGIVVVLILALILLVGKRTVATRTLKVGVRTDVANFGYYDESIDTYYGLEIDLAKELAERMEYSGVEFVPVNATNREEKLDNGDIDCLIACFTDTDERREKYSLSESYFEDRAYIIAKETTLFVSISDLEGCTIGTVRNTSLEKTLSDTFRVNGVNKYNTQLFEDYESLIAALEIGSIDAIMMDGSMYYNYVDDDVFLGGNVYSSNFCVATAKNSSLSSTVNSKVSEIIEDGTMRTIIDRWIDGELYGFSE